MQIALKIDNFYPDGKVATHVVTEVIAPTVAELTDDAALDEWAYDQLFEHTGTGRIEGDSAYFIEVESCDEPRLVGRTFEMGT